MSQELPCVTPDQLHAWIVTHTGLRVPRQAVCPGHHAPFDYLCNSYFEPSADQIIWAPRGGGKTSLAAVATLLDLLHKPGCSVRILGGSLEQSLKMWDYLLPHLEEIARDELENPRAMSRKLKLRTGSSAAVLTQSQKSVRGLRVQKLRCDEVELFDADVWEAAQLTTRTRTPSDENSGLMIRGTIEALSTLHRPVGLMHKIIEAAETNGTRLVRWCMLDVLERCPPERDCNTCGLWTECRGVAKTRCDGFFHIDDALAMKSRVSEDTWNNEMLCRRPSVRGCVFPMFDPDLHVIESPPFEIDGGCEWSLAMDFGFSAPLVCLWVVTRGEQVYVIDEHLLRQKTLDEHLKLISARPWPNVRRIACDPAGNGSNDQTAVSNIALLRRAGYQVRSKPSRIVDGVELIRAALRSAAGESRLRVHPRCKQLIQALRGYRYPENRQSELPDKDGQHDHAIDALRYFFVNQNHTALTARRY
ncbi:MAG TPA: hypothetical protein VGB55_09285 [Tepidisphaeraceae bacterium]|jgi:hypothetical protein